MSIADLEKEGEQAVILRIVTTLSGALEFYPYAGAATREHPLSSGASADKGLSPFNISKLVPASHQTVHFSELQYMYHAAN